MHYHANAAALRQLGIWFEELQEAGVYDNTRIIVVADHGGSLYSSYFDGFSGNMQDFSCFSPLLLFKDFDSTGGYVVDDSFMTHADAPLLAIQDLDVSSINPFTKNDVFESVDKKDVNVYAGPWIIRDNPVNVFKPYLSESFSVHDSIFEEANWTRLE